MGNVESLCILVRAFRKVWKNTVLISKGNNKGNVVKYKCCNKHLYNAYLHNTNIYIHIRIMFNSMSVKFRYSTRWWDVGGKIEQGKRISSTLYCWGRESSTEPHQTESCKIGDIKIGDKMPWDYWKIEVYIQDKESSITNYN